MQNKFLQTLLVTAAIVASTTVHAMQQSEEGAAHNATHQPAAPDATVGAEGEPLEVIENAVKAIKALREGIIKELLEEREPDVGYIQRLKSAETPFLDELRSTRHQSEGAWETWKESHPDVAKEMEEAMSKSAAQG